MGTNEHRRVIWLDRLRMSDLALVGGKNASLGEMIGELQAEGVRVPGGFATTAFAFHGLPSQDGLAARMERALSTLDVDDVAALARTGAEIRGWVSGAALPAKLEAEIGAAYAQLTVESPDLRVAIRSSATAEDLPDASFA